MAMGFLTISIAIRCERGPSTARKCEAQERGTQSHKVCTRRRATDREAETETEIV